MSISRVAVVGAGVLGVAAAREVTRRLPDAAVTVIDKADSVAAHQSGHTSGIVDAGLEQIPDSTAAALARRGVQLLIPYMAERGVPYRECGQLMIAQNTDEAERLEELFARAEDNAIPGVRLLERHEIREVEPAVRGVLGLWAPHAAVADFAALAEELASDVRLAGGTMRFGTEVTGFDVMSNEVRLRGRTAPARAEPAERDAESGAEHGADDEPETAADDADRRAEQVHDRPRTYRGDETREPIIGVGDELRDRFGEQEWFKQAESTIGQWREKLSSSWSRSSDTRPADTPTEEVLGTFDMVIVCAGLQADRLAVAAGSDAQPRIVPFTGDHYTVPPTGAEAVRGIVGSVPDPHAPFAETSILRGLDDALVLGPNTFVALGRETYDRRGFDLGDIGSTARFKGFWKYAAQTARTAARGVRPRVSRSAFVDGVRRFVPGLEAASVEEGSRGVRAQAMNDDGELIDDLVTTVRGRLTMVRAVPKWGATSALAIAETIVDRVMEGLAR
ncbi:FAD-dependent oxidoreductase [Brevibacterium renqingii]|uniref:FAD-dependent oxidoreductase n=1 Tax=Brevibacterium renqingii TaxID=2776916 RepID=UPI001C116671|nr:FAD-dependent oxidoreductase [Brevibacterium renqingii]